MIFHKITDESAVAKILSGDGIPEPAEYEVFEPPIPESILHRIKEKNYEITWLGNLDKILYKLGNNAVIVLIDGTYQYINALENTLRCYTWYNGSWNNRLRNFYIKIYHRKSKKFNFKKFRWEVDTEIKDLCLHFMLPAKALFDVPIESYISYGWKEYRFDIESMKDPCLIVFNKYNDEEAYFFQE